ncbi:MAG: TerC/Alx family metal homeostasis membrane protein [Saprospiraceae bacterium]|nr:TerC/Alx family metal homeostasis membrane protein [Saprospiraceae bacterium]
MIAYFGYILFLIVAVFIDYQLFATESASQHKKAVHSIIYWLIITCLSVGFIYLSYEQDWFGGYQSHDTSSSTMNAISSFISGFLLEQSLSIDNIFVIAFLLKYFKVPVMYQNGLLSIGIWSAIVLRGIMIFAGLWLINSISWMVYILGLVLIYSGIKIFKTDPNKQSDPNKTFIIRLLRKWFPVTKTYFGGHFFVKKMGVWALTPMFLTLVAIEFTDILFAIDSIPAIFAVTTDPFIVLSSNILAVANLRALFTILSRILEKLEYIHYALSILLIFIGIKIMLEHYVKIADWLNMIIIVCVLLIGTLYSLWRSKKEKIEITE